MRKSIALLGLCAAIAIAAPAWSQEQKPYEMHKIVRLQGWVVDEHCGATAASADKKDQILKDHEDGSPLVFAADDGTLYTLDKQDAAVDFVGRHVLVFGAIDESHNLRVGQFAEIKTKPAAQDEGSDSKSD